MENMLQAYLKSDRCWTRPLRIAHAKYMLQEAGNYEDKKFWQAVLNANEDKNENV